MASTRMMKLLGACRGARGPLQNEHILVGDMPAMAA